MICITIFKRIVLGVLFITALLIPAVIAHADTYQVTAQVPYAVPSVPAVIQTPQDATNVDTAMQNISGSCEVTNPSTIVSIWRGGEAVGSSVCQPNGTFSLTLQLVTGPNDLLSRSSNISNVYGPDGTSVRITYRPHIAPAATTTDQTPPQESDLNVTSATPFGVLSEKDNSVTIQIIVKGSATPFDILINWGDGTTETKSVPAAGTYAFTHTYDKSATYSLRATVTDVLGATTVYTVPIVPTSVAPKPTEVNSTIVKGTSLRSSIIPYVVGGAVLTVFGSTAFFAGEGFSAMHTSKKRMRVKARKKIKK